MKNLSFRFVLVFILSCLFVCPGSLAARQQHQKEKTQNQAHENTKANSSTPTSNTSNASASTGTQAEIPVLTTTTVLKNLVIPWEIRFLSKDTWLITECPGYLTILQGDSIKRFKIPEVEHMGESGLLGLAIHPNFNSNHWIYLYRTTQKSGKTINQVIRYQLENNKLSKEKMILDDIPGSSIHNGGRIAFGPDQYLYITTGDAGQPALAQDKTSLAGKVLRVDEEGKIPAENPFNNAVFSYGHRNPLGLAWDDKGQLWSTESSGNTGYDKLNIILLGKNYGWPNVKVKENAKDLEKPALTSGWNNLWNPAGLAFWNSKLYFGGLKSQALYEVDLSTKPFKVTKYFENQFGRISSVNVGLDQALYVATSNQDGQAAEKNAEDDIIIRIPRPRSRSEIENAKIDAEFPVSNSFR